MKDINQFREEHPTIVLLYNIVIGALAIISIVIAVRSFKIEQSAAELMIDRIIWIIFVADYIFRFAIAPEKKRFFVRNIIDLIAILPVVAVFQFFRFGRVIRAVRLLRLLKFARAGARFARFFKRAKQFLDTNGFKYVLLSVIGMVCVAGVIMMISEHITFLDGLWWSIVTITTVGYGDIAPTSDAGRILAVILMVFGVGLIGSLTSTITAFFMNAHADEQNEFVSVSIRKLERFDELSLEDVKEISRILICLKETKDAEEV